MASRVVGLDIGSSAIKVTQAKLGGDRVAIERSAIAEIPAGYIRGGVIVEAHVDDVSAILKRLWKDEKLAKDVIIGVNDGGSIFSRPADFTWREPDALRKTLPFEAAERDLIPGGGAQHEFDFVPLGESVGPDQQRMAHVFLVTAKRESIKRTLDAVNGAGLRPVGADLNSFATLRATPVSQNASRRFDIIVDIGAEVTTFLIHRNGSPLHLRMSDKESGNGVNNFIYRELGLTNRAEAEKLKVNRDDLVRDCLRRVAATHARQVGHYVRTFMDNNPEETGAATMTLLGGTALVDGFAEEIQKTGVPVIRGEIDERSFSVSGSFSPVIDGHDMLASAGLTNGSRLK